MELKKTSRKTLIILILIFILALALRGLVFIKFKDNMALKYDPRNYWLMSHQLADKGIFGYWYDGNPFGGRPGVSNARVMPGYPLFLAGVYKIVGDPYLQITAVRLLQTGISSLSVLLAFAFVKRVFKKDAAALISAMFTAVYPTYVFSCVQLLTEVLALFTMLLYFWLAVIAFDSRKFGHNLLAGAAFGLHILIRPTMLPLFIMPFVFILLSNRIQKKKASAQTAGSRKFAGIAEMPYKAVAIMFAAQLVAFMAVMAPWWIRNAVVLDKFIITATASGNPLLAGTYPYFQDFMKDVTDDIRGINDKQQALGIKRIIAGLKTDPWLYIKWFTIGKTGYTFEKPYLYNLFASTRNLHFGIHYFILIAGVLGVLWHSAVSSRAFFFYLYGLMFFALQLMFVPDPRFAYQVMFFLMTGASHLLAALYETAMRRNTGKEQAHGAA